MKTDYRSEVSKLSGALLRFLPEGYEKTKPSAVDTAINLIDDLQSFLRTAQSYYCHESCGVSSHDDDCKKMTDLSKLRLVLKGGEHGDHNQGPQTRPWFEGQAHLEQQPHKEVHEGGKSGNDLLDEDTKNKLISRLQNWKFATAWAVFDSLPAQTKEALKSDISTESSSISNTIETLAEQFGNCGWFEGQMGDLVGSTVGLLIEKVKEC